MTLLVALNMMNNFQQQRSEDPAVFALQLHETCDTRIQ
jgi:hypothetical protein